METTKTEVTIFSAIGLQATPKEVKQGAWVAIPKDRTLLQSKTWQALRSGPKAGIGSSPTEAAILLALAAGKAGQGRPPSKQQAAKVMLENLLRDGIARTVEEIRGLAQAKGISWTAADRAARDLGVLRKKCGLRGPWIWSLPFAIQV